VYRFNSSSGLNAEWFSRLWTADYNARVDCSSPCLPEIDLTKWKTVLRTVRRQPGTTEHQTLGLY